MISFDHLAINKPIGISSAQALRDIQIHFDPSRLFAPLLSKQAASDANSNNQRHRRRRRYAGPPQVKIGHGGTLDPLATGVLIAGIGAGTKELGRFLECTKTYEAVILFGAATDTYDTEGKVIARKPYGHITEDMVREALGRFKGKILQKPPIYSALRVEGKRLYEYAREGKTPPVEIKERPVEVLDLKLTEWMEGGGHHYKWPDREAEQEKRADAEMLLHPKDKESDHREAKSVENASIMAELKRKRDVDLDGVVTDSPELKKQRESSELPISGVLHLAPDGNESNTDDHTSDANPSSTTQLSGLTESVDKKASNPPAARISMTVTSGFYVRSLCHDLGQAVGSLAIMSGLVRTGQAGFELGKNVLEYEDLSKGEEVWGPQVEDILDRWKPIGKQENQAK